MKVGQGEVTTTDCIFRAVYRILEELGPGRCLDEARSSSVLREEEEGDGCDGVGYHDGLCFRFVVIYDNANSCELL